MTLSRGPYSELDKMSLFQDLKLKRRKVDSRCSSDGESIADTSTSSPDLLQPLSPKMCDQQQQQQQQQAPPAHPSLQQKGLSVKDAPSPPTTPATVDDEHELLVCSSAGRGFDDNAADDGGGTSGSASSDRSGSFLHHGRRLNGGGSKEEGASHRHLHHHHHHHQQDSYQEDDSGGDSAQARSDRTPATGSDGATVNAASLKDEVYEGNSRVSPDTSPEVLTDERTPNRNGGGGGGSSGRGNASNATAASVIRSVADERRPRSVNPPAASTIAATSSSGSGSNVINTNSCGRPDSAASIKIPTGHNSSSGRCAAATTTTATAAGCGSECGTSSNSTSATLINSIESLHQHYGKECAGVDDDDGDRTAAAAHNGMDGNDTANSSTATTATAGNIRSIVGSGQTQQHVTVLVTPPSSRMKSNHLSTAEGNGTATSTVTSAAAAAAAAAAATTLVTLGMRKQQSLPPPSTEPTSLSSASSSSTSPSSGDRREPFACTDSETSNAHNASDDADDVEHTGSSRSGTRSPSASSTDLTTATTTTTAVVASSSPSPSHAVSLAFHQQSLAAAAAATATAGVGGLSSSKIVSSQAVAAASRSPGGAGGGPMVNSQQQQQHVIITQQQMLQAMHQQIRIKKERQQQQQQQMAVAASTLMHGNHRPLNAGFPAVHHAHAQQLVIKRERGAVAAGGLKLPLSPGSLAAAHTTIVRQAPTSPGPMATVHTASPMQPPVSPHQSLPYRQAGSPVQVGSSCGGTQQQSSAPLQPQVIIKRERGSSMHHQQPFHHQPQSSSIASSVCVSGPNPAGGLTTNSITTTATSSSVASTAGGALTLRNPIRDAAILFRVKNEANSGNALVASQQQQQQQHHRMVWPAPAALAAAAVVSSGTATTPHRINGVKPEVIGGPLPPIRNQLSSPHHHHHQQQQQQQQQQQTSPHHQQQSPQHHHSSPGPVASQTPSRATPTVIMGESCGVRTMVWSYDTTLQQAHNAASSTNTGGGGHPGTESAPTGLGPHPQHHHQQQSTLHQHLHQQQQQPQQHTVAGSTLNHHHHHHHHHQQGPQQTNGGMSNSGNGGIITTPNTNNGSNGSGGSSHNNVSPSSNNEEAAHLLLSLGQSVVPSTPSTNAAAAAAAVAAAAAAVVAGHTPAWPATNHARTTLPLNMERLWAGDYGQFAAVGSQQQHQQQQALNLTSQQQQQQQHLAWGLSGTGVGGPKKELLDDMPPDEDDQPLVCMICEDKATGLHYGIITCEGCKGFFKRTVQNRRVYTCVADGTCEITKAQRNRCQYCRFKKCIEQGMVLQAVREDRMPGGRNSGAVYNLYKVKYKKHKKNNQKPTNVKLHQGAGAMGVAVTNLSDIGVVGAGVGTQGGGIGSGGSGESPKPANMYHHHQQQQQQQQQQQHASTHSQQHHHLPSTTSPTMIKSESMNLSLLNGTILKTALTNPSEIVHLRHRLDNAVSSSKDRAISYEQALNMIHTLIDCDAMEDIATLPHFSEFLADKSEIGDKLCNIGDSIVHKLVSWTRKLPFYTDIPVEIHTKLLTDKWHEILVLTTAAYQAMHGKKSIGTTQTQSGSTGFVLAPDKNDPEFTEEITSHLHTLQSCLTTLMGHPISIEQLKIDVGQMVEKMTQITIMFRRIKLKMEEYVCLKVYILLNKEVELESIQERYIQVLRSYLQHTVPHNPNRLSDLLAHIPEIQTAASLLLESKMFYVPFVLNSANIR